MDPKELRFFREAYGSIYEGYGKKEEKEEKEEGCVSKSEKGEHNCAKKVCHEQFGEGQCIFGEHAVPDENGFVSHYDVMFEHGIEKNVPVSEMKVLISEEHPKEGHRYEGELVDGGMEEVETDLFDYLLEYLVAEGYADTNKAALAIMANMSEEWRQSIVEASEEDKQRLLNYEVRYYQKHGGMPPDPEKRRQLRDAARRLPPA